MNMRLTVESTVGGSLSGFLSCTVSEDDTVKSVVTSFCESKDVQWSPNLVLRNHHGILLDNKKTIQEAGLLEGDIVYLGILGTESAIFRFNNWWLLAFCALFVACAGLTTAIALYLSRGETPFGYGIVMDGGSSHTALNIYQWDGPKWKGTGVLRQIADCNLNGDVASMALNISGIEKFLQPCLTYAHSKIPSVSRSSAPIYFGATAGLRLLNLTHPERVNYILESIRLVLSRSGFLFERNYVDVLSGKDEGRCSWVTVNSQLKNLGPTNLYLSNNVQLTIHGEETVGALDLGGASTQISMEIPLNHSRKLVQENGHLHLFTKSNDEEITTIPLYGKNYSIYSESHLCYGILEAFRRYHSLVIQDPKRNETVLSSPCHPEGYNMNITIDKVFHSPCVSNQSDILTNQLMSYPDKNITLMGSSNSRQCADHVNGLFNTTYCAAHFPADTCFTNPNQPHFDHQSFMAFSSFYFTAVNFNITNGTSLKEFRSTVENVCNMTYEQVLQLPLLVPNSSFTPLTCLEGQYVLSLLTLGYGFDDSSWNGLKFIDKIADTEVGWSLGYMTERTNGIGATEAKRLLLFPVFTTLAVLFSLFLIVGLVLTYHAIRLKRSSARYSRLNIPERHHTYGSLTMWL